MPNQEDLLLLLVQNEEGKEWASTLVGWRKSNVEPACQWEGITCDPVDRESVVSIHISGTDFFGTIPSELGKLESLKSINLRKNQVFGTIPPEVAGLPKLEEIDLGLNKLIGTIPEFKSPTLTKIILDGNDIEGTLPDIDGPPYQVMKEINFANNHLTGTIPTSLLARIPRINAIDLSANELSGTIPDDLGNLRFLEFLYLSSNNLMGYIPPNLAKSFNDNSESMNILRELWLQNNTLSGTIPPNFATLDLLVDFFVDGNKLTGEVPSDLCRITLNQDFFEGVDERKIKNLCDAVACPVGYSAEQGVYPCTPCISKRYNPYLGKSGQCTVLNQRLILDDFYRSTSANGKWDGVNNWCQDDVFICDYSGVTCDENNRVIRLELSGRGLKGKITPGLGFLEHLQVLDLSSNELSGFLPSDLRWAPLEVLDISGNNIQGIVPPTLCLKSGINGNGENGDFNCKKISCPAGTYSSLGRESSSVQCVPCKNNMNNMIIGKTRCDQGIARPRYQAAGGSIIGLIFLICALISLLGWVLTRKWEKTGFVTRKSIELTQREAERDAMMDQYVASIGLRRNNNASSSLPHPDEVKGRSRKIKNSIVDQYSSRFGNKMPPPPDPLYIGTFPNMDDSSSTLSTGSGGKSSRNLVKSPERKGPRRGVKYESVPGSDNNEVENHKESNVPRNSSRVTLHDESKEEDDDSKATWLDVPNIT